MSMTALSVPLYTGPNGECWIQYGSQISELRPDTKTVWGQSSR